MRICVLGATWSALVKVTKNGMSVAFILGFFDANHFIAFLLDGSGGAHHYFVLQLDNAKAKDAFFRSRNSADRYEGIVDPSFKMSSPCPGLNRACSRRRSSAEIGDIGNTVLDMARAVTSRARAFRRRRCSGGDDSAGTKKGLG